MLNEVLRNLEYGLPRSRGPIDLSTAMRYCHTPGVGIALIEGGTIVETVFAGVREAGRSDPVTADTLFQVGSISKAVAAACALRLVADGVVDLDEDVNQRLRSWRIPANDGWQPRVTLRRLLSHTAATTVGGFIGYPRGEPVPSVPDLFEGRGNSEPLAVTGLPGLRFRYSGGGYTVMQQLLEDVTGRDFPTLARDLVLDRVGMRDSTYAQPLPDKLTGRAATGHHPGPVPVPGQWHTYPEMAAAGLWSTATDLARFFLAIRASIDGQPDALLPQEIAVQLTVPGADVPYGLGLSLDPPGTIGHGGDTQGYNNVARLYLHNGQGIVITTNAYYGQELINVVLVPAVAQARGWRDDETPPAGAVPPGPLRYDGLELEPAGDDLMLRYDGQPPVRLYAGAGGRWHGRSVNVDAWFDGTALVLQQDGTTTRPGPDPAR